MGSVMYRNRVYDMKIGNVMYKSVDVIYGSRGV